MNFFRRHCDPPMLCGGEATSRLAGACFLITLVAMTAQVSSAGSEAYDRYLHGLLAERKGDFTTALSDYQKAVELDPQATEVFRDLAELNLRTGRTDAALRAAQHVRDLAPSQSSSFLFLGHVHVARGNLALAAQEYEKALELDPQNLKALENLGSYYSSINGKKSLDYYERYLKIEPEDPEIHFQLGFIHQKLGDTPKAIAAFKKSVTLDPSQIASNLALAELYELTRSTAAAIAAYQKCIELDPRNPAFYSRLGLLYFNNKEWDDAASQFQNSRSLAPNDTTQNYYLARIAEERGQWKQASDLAEQSYAMSKDPQFLPLLAYYLTMQHRTKEAVKWLEKARRADPENPNILLFLGMDYLELDQPKKAEVLLSQAIRSHPKDAQLRFQLGITYDRLGRFDEAVAEFLRVLQIDPKNAPAMNYLGYSYADRGIKLDEAEKYIQNALKLDPQNGAYLDSLGWVHFKQGKLAEAIPELERAVIAQPEALVYEHLGDANWADKKIERALQVWSKAYALDPDNKALKKKIDQATTQIPAGPQQRKFLKYVEGNFRQISDLRGLAFLEGHWNKDRVKTQGGVYYLRPDRFLLAVGAPAAPVARVAVRGQKVQVHPREMGDAWSRIGLDGLTWLTHFFSGKLITPLDTPDVVVDQQKSNLHYKAASEEAWIDPSRGVLVAYSRDNPQGGRDLLKVDGYELVEGLWLPKTLRIENRQLGWEATLRFSDWQINQPQTAQIFNSLQP